MGEKTGSAASAGKEKPNSVEYVGDPFDGYDFLKQKVKASEVLVHDIGKDLDSDREARWRLETEMEKLSKFV